MTRPARQWGEIKTSTARWENKIRLVQSTDDFLGYSQNNRGGTEIVPAPDVTGFDVSRAPRNSH